MGTPEESAELFDLRMSEAARPLLKRVTDFLEKVVAPMQERRWLEPLLNGEIRSAYAMTEPDVASSDAKNVQLRAERFGDDYVLNGEKYYISGAGDPQCKVMIVMCRTNPDGPPHKQQS